MSECLWVQKLRSKLLCPKFYQRSDSKLVLTVGSSDVSSILQCVSQWCTHLLFQCSRGSTRGCSCITRQSRGTKVDKVCSVILMNFLTSCSFRVTYNLDHNFVVRYMPGRVHQMTIQYWNYAFAHALNGLVSIPLDPFPPGCEPIGATSKFQKQSLSLLFMCYSAFVLGPRRKEADSGVRPTASIYPSVVLEVGSSESLSQLQIDARLWLEHLAEVLRISSLFFHPLISVRSILLSLFLLTLPSPPTALLKSSSSNGDLFLLFLLHSLGQKLNDGTKIWSRVMTGLSMRLPFEYRFLTSLVVRFQLLMVTITMWI